MSDFAIIYGSLRSGTTMLRLMLDAHSRIACPGETDFLVDHIDPAAGAYDRAALAANRIYRASRADMPAGLDGAAAARAMIGQLRGDAAGPLMLMHHRRLDRLLDLFPDAPVIHMVRDPRDVARSAIGMGWAGNTYYGAETWLTTERDWDAAAGRLRPGQVHDVKYEELVRDPAAALGAICAFVGEAFEPAMLTYHENTTYEAPDVGLIEQWRRKQTPRDLGLTEPLFGDRLTARGYEPSGHPPITPSAAEARRLWLENKRAIWRFRFSRYGVADPLTVAVAGKLGLVGLQRLAQRRIDAKVAQQVK